MFLYAFFCKVLNIFPLSLYPLPLPPPPRRGYGWGWVEGGVFLDCFFGILRGGMKGMGGGGLSTYTQMHYRLE